MTLRREIARVLEDPQDLILARSILGSVDPDEIAGWVEAHVSRVLGRRVAGCRHFIQSVGAVWVLELDDRERVVLKAHTLAGTAWRAFHTLAELEAVYDAQAELANRGIPCARVLAPPQPFARGAAAIMSALPDVRVPDAHDPDVRRAMAALLAQTVELGKTLAARDRLPRFELPATLFPPPHNALFDFDRPGGEAIDERARAARTVLDRDPPPLVVMHSDVSCANIRVHDGRVTAVFDMDSLCWIDEMRCVASAAVHFTYTSEPPWRWPTEDETQAFIADYAAARGRPLDVTERERLDAAVEYARAYTARCEYGIRTE